MSESAAIAPRTTTCGHCGTRFVSDNPSRRWCSPRCRRAASDARLAGTCEVCGEALTNPRAERHAGCTRFWTEERCLEALRGFAERYGRTPTAGELGVGHDRRKRVDWLPPGEVLRRRFGSRRQAIVAAGLEPRGTGDRVARPVWSARAIAEAIRAWAAEHGKQPSSDEWRRAGAGRPCTGTVIHVFGSWSEGIRAAGFEPRLPGRRA